MTNPEQLLKASFPAQAEQLQVIRQVLQDAFAAQNCPKPIADRWVLAINEACMNIIQHAYGCQRASESDDSSDGDSEIIVEVWRSAQEWTFRLTDFAEPVDKTKVRSRDLDDIRPGGLGVHFIREVMDEVEFLESGNIAGNKAVGDETVDHKTVDHKKRGNILQMKGHLPHKEGPSA